MLQQESELATNRRGKETGYCAREANPMSHTRNHQAKKAKILSTTNVAEEVLSLVINHANKFQLCGIL